VGSYLIECEKHHDGGGLRVSQDQAETIPKSLRVLLETGSMAGMTDSELIERFTASRDSGAEAAFGALVSRHGPMVLGTCRLLTGDPHTAEDAFQAVFMVLARRARSVRRPELVGPWLHGVATKIARKARLQADRRHRREKTEVEMAGIESMGSEGAACTIRNEDAAAVHEEIGRLPERYRRAVVLSHFEGLTHAKAARRLGCAPGTVSSLVSRARDLLRNRLVRRGLNLGALVVTAVLEPKLVSATVPFALERATIQAAVSFATKRAIAAGIVSQSASGLVGETLKAMMLTRLALIGLLVVTLGVAVAAGGLAATRPRAIESRLLQAQARQKNGNAPPRPLSPSLPGAVLNAPPWLGNPAPFDLATFFAAPWPEENAAPRYLEALFEFGPQVEVCFPEGADRQSRAQAVEQRLARFYPLFQSWSKEEISVPAATIDAMLSEFDTGFRKLDWAQQRPRCVFQSGIGATARVPHAQVVSNVVRVARVKVRRELERGELDAAVRDLTRLLRLSRDLLPRGVMITALVSSTAERGSIEHVVLPMLTAKGLTVEHCDRILALLREHEVRSIDAYAEGLRAEYVSNRATLHDLIFVQGRLRKEWESFGNQAGPSIVAEIAEPVLMSALAGNAPLPKPTPGERIKSITQRLMSLRNVQDLDALMARTTPAELASQVSKLNELYGGLLSLSEATVLEQIRRSTDRPHSLGGVDLQTRVTRGASSSAFKSYTQSLGTAKARIRVAQALLAVRRWQLAHGANLPASMEAVAREAGLRTVPIDPFDGQPIRFTILEGQPTVYSVGQDGRDDGGRIDNARTPDSGDVLLRLPRS
jgi:RNA polymerase sigma factor (sigma-70 family)